MCDRDHMWFTKPKELLYDSEQKKFADPCYRI